MRVSLLLLAYAGLLAIAGTGLLGRARWVDWAPRLGILAWQAVTGSIVVSVLLAGLALTVPTLPVAAGLAEFLRSCVMMIQAQYASPAGAAVATAGLLLAGAVAARVGFCLARALHRATAARRRHLGVLDIVGRPEQRLGATVVEHETAEVYCLPGRRGRIVLTTAALAALDPDQLATVLAHERAHLRARHDLAIAAASALAAAFGRVPAFAAAHEQIARLVELAADDAATRRGDRLNLAAAILTVAGGRTPAAALGAAGTASAARVRRLLAPRRRLGVMRTGFAAVGCAAVLAIPVGLAAAPAAAVAGMPYCPLPPASAPVTLPAA